MRALWRRVVTTALVAAVLAPAQALASQASITLSDDAGPPTTRLRVTGTGFAPSERVVVAFDRQVLKRVRSSQEGAFTAKFQVPASAAPGDHVIIAKGKSSGRATAPFTVRTDWPTFHFDNAKSGHNPYENVLGPSNVGDLEVSWSRNLGDAVRPAPVVVDGVLYAGADSPSMDIFALDPATGEVFWEVSLSGCCPSDLAVWRGRLYVSSANGHAMHVLDTETGELLLTIPGPTHGPTVANGRVFASDNLGTLWAFDAITGEELWEAHSSFLGYGFGVAVAGGIVYAGADDDRVYAYDAATGEEVWSVLTGDEVNSTPAVVDGVAYVGSTDDYLYAIDAVTGEVRWTAATGAGIEDTAAVAGGVVYVGSTDDYLYAFDALTGDLVWQVPHDGGTVQKNPVVASGVLYVGSLDDSVYAHDTTTGAILWSFQTGDSTGEVILVDGTVFLGSTDNRLYAFRLPAGGSSSEMTADS
jgi:outer membrane protein assembly factor BamB